MAKVPKKYLAARSDEILAAATECFARNGYRGTSMANIASEAGLSVGALYRYFARKDSLFHALTKRSAKLNQILWEETAPQEGAAARLRMFVDNYFDMAAQPRCRSSLALDVRLRGEALDSAIVRREVEKSYLAQLETIAKLLRSAKGGDQDERTTQAQAHAVIAMLAGAGLQILAGTQFDLAGYRRVVLAIIDGWIAGEAPPDSAMRRVGAVEQTCTEEAESG